MLDFVPFASFACGANLETDKSSTTAAKAKRVREGRERERRERQRGEGGREENRGLQQRRPDDVEAGGRAEEEGEARPV